MNTEQEQQDQGILQHDAEHERPRKRNSVLVYLIILFAAAFLLLLMSYFSQRRDSQAAQAAIEDLRQNSSVAAESQESLLAERDALLEERDGLNDTISGLEQQIADLERQLQEGELQLERTRDDIQWVQAQVDALNQLNQLRILYNQRRNREARELLAQYPEMEGWLEEISAAMTEEARAIYDPLDAYRTIVGVLNPYG